MNRTLQYEIEGGRQAAVTHEVADVKFPMLSVSKMVEHGATVVYGPWGSFSVHDPDGIIQRAVMDSQLAQEKVDFIKKAGVYWLPGRLSSNSTVSNGHVDHLCPLGVDSPDPQATADAEGDMVVRTKRVPVEPSAEEVLKHNLTHLPPRSWCPHCVNGHGI